MAEKTEVATMDGFCKNLGFRVGFGYRNNTNCPTTPGVLCTVWRPLSQKDTRLLERVQYHVMGMIPGYKHIPYRA